MTLTPTPFLWVCVSIASSLAIIFLLSRVFTFSFNFSKTDVFTTVITMAPPGEQKYRLTSEVVQGFFGPWTEERTWAKHVWVGPEDADPNNPDNWELVKQGKGECLEMKQFFTGNET